GERSAGTGAVQTLALAAGFLFVSLYGGVLADLESVLFGNVLGVSDSQLLVLSLVAAALLLALAVLARPLLFASLDPEVAAARGWRPCCAPVAWSVARAGPSSSGPGCPKAAMLGQAFMRNALLAGTSIALACGVSGWFVVLRGQVFAGDALSHVAFPAALAAAAAGIDQRAGLFVATVAVGALIGILGRAGRSQRGALPGAGAA